MFSAAVQPALVSLFSSTGSEPLTLFSSHVDKSLPADSCICLLKDSTSLPPPPPPANLLNVESAGENLNDADRSEHVLDQTILHVQSPSLRKTYIRCPPVGWSSPGRGSRTRRTDLGIEHPWVHLQVRNLHKEWSFEVGIVDRSGREGIVRCSTFQVPLSFHIVPCIIVLVLLPEPLWPQTCEDYSKVYGLWVRLLTRRFSPEGTSAEAGQASAAPSTAYIPAHVFSPADVLVNRYPQPLSIPATLLFSLADAKRSA